MGVPMQTTIDTLQIILWHEYNVSFGGRQVDYLKISSVS